MPNANPPTNQQLQSTRRQYEAPPLLETHAPSDPWALFETWLQQARLSDETQAGVLDATSMSLATSDAQGRPSLRTVLLKGLSDQGLIFYTGYESRKALDLAENPQAAMLFHWSNTSRQVHFEGTVGRLTSAESDSYFASRPRESQLAARASVPAGPIPDRASLDKLYKAEEALWLGREVERPEQWGGFMLRPIRVEFWQGQPNRLHDRLVYEYQPNESWQRSRLKP